MSLRERVYSLFERVSKGKKVEKTFDLEVATAEFWSNGYINKVTRTGYVYYFIDDELHVKTGSSILKSYLNSATNFIESDDGEFIPVINMTKVCITKKEKLHTEYYYE